MQLVKASTTVQAGAANANDVPVATIATRRSRSNGVGLAFLWMVIRSLPKALKLGTSNQFDWDLTDTLRKAHAQGSWSANRPVRPVEAPFPRV